MSFTWHFPSAGRVNHLLSSHNVKSTNSMQSNSYQPKRSLWGAEIWSRWFTQQSQLSILLDSWRKIITTENEWALDFKSLINNIIPSKSLTICNCFDNFCYLVTATITIIYIYTATTAAHFSSQVCKQQSQCLLS